MTTVPGASGRRERRQAVFDPWKFGSIAIPPDLRREIMATKLPAIPSDRLYAGLVSRASERAPLGPKQLLVAGAVVSLALVAIYWMLT